jgi:hypothetical protein
LTSDAFEKIASADLASKIDLTPNSKAGYYRLRLPKVGKRVVDALVVFAGCDIDPKEAVAAEQLAAAIEQRLSVG